MTKISQDTVMGTGIVITSLLLLFREQWVLTHTQKGRKLVVRFGDRAAVWIYRGILAVTAVFGGLLAGDVIRPIQWGFHERSDHWALPQKGVWNLPVVRQINLQQHR